MIPGKPQRMKTSCTQYLIRISQQKKRGEGTGLGHAVVHDAVKRPTEGILVKTKPGIGTTFDIFLPVKNKDNHFKTKPDQFDIMITAMTMPNMTGKQLFLEIRKINEEIPVIICTGYSKHFSEKRGKKD